MASPFTSAEQQFFDNNGNPLAGGKVFTYLAGTTTPKAAFTTKAGTTQLPNPVILDAAGRAEIWLEGAYRIDVRDTNDVLISTQDNVESYASGIAVTSTSPFFQSFSGNNSQTSFTLSQNLGTDENTVMIYVDNGLRQHVTNGSFATDTDWTRGAGWTIGSGVATATGAISTALSQNSAITLVAGRTYALTYTVTRSAGGIIPSIGGQNGVERTANGTYREVIVAGSSQVIAFTGNGFTGTIDDVSVTLADGLGFEILNPNQYTLNGTNLTFTTAPNTGTNNIMVFAPSTFIGAAQASAAAADASATAAAASASSASSSASSASASAATALAAAYFGTSTTSNTIGIGSRSFTTQTGKNFQVGGFLLISSTASPANFMHGQVTSYNSGTGALVMDITNVGGSGTLASWNIYVSGTRGPQGPTGPSGSLPDGNYGDWTVSGGGTVATINNAVVSNAKLANMAANTVKVRAAGTSGAPTDLALGASQVIGRGSTGDLRAVNFSEIGSNRLVNTAYVETATWTTSGSNISYADTIPTISQGVEILSINYTPASASNLIILVASVNATSTSGGRQCAAIFDGGTNAIAAAGCSGNSSQMMTIVVQKRVSAGSTSMRTYSVRCGETSGSIGINGTGSNRIYGGAAFSSLTIYEVTP